MAFSPIYFTIADVKPWLQGKMTFGTDPNTTMSDVFLNQLCAFAEAEVVNDLNPFYEVPLVSKSTDDYAGLPQETRAFLGKLFITKSVQLILEEDFGQKSSVISSDYSQNMAKQYYNLLGRITAKDTKTGQYRYAPLPGLKINKYNWTGLKVVPAPGVTRGPVGVPNNLDYATRQITQPARSWWSFEDIDGANNTTGT